MINVKDIALHQPNLTEEKIMKLLIPLIVLATMTNAHAHPGGSLLTCKSQKMEISLKRSNGTGWFAPIIEVTKNNRSYVLHTPEETGNYGVTFHNTPLKVITVTVDVPSIDNINSGDFSIIAMPSTVQSFDYDGKPTKWNLEDEKDECYDSAGSAKFKGIIRGYLNLDKGVESIETEIMDCELTYNSGMAC